MKTLHLTVALGLAAAAAVVSVRHLVTDALSNPGEVVRVANANDRRKNSSSSDERNASHRTMQSTSWNVVSVDPAQAATVAKLEKAALQRVDALDKELALNSVQRRQIMELVIAFSAPPEVAICMGGRNIVLPHEASPDFSLEDAIVEKLDPERARKYQQSLIEHAAWWDHAIEQMESTVADDSPIPAGIVEDDS